MDMGFKDSMLRGRIDGRRKLLNRAKPDSPEYLQIKRLIEEDEAELQNITNASDQKDKKGNITTLFGG
jgi:hypothetical protein